LSKGHGTPYLRFCAGVPFPCTLEGPLKLTFIGAGGARTPLVIQSLLDHQDRVPLTQVCMMDIDAERLDLIRMVCKPRIAAGHASFEITWTTDARQAIAGADYVVLTFRVGQMASRVIDEQVPLRYGVLGQETTGPGGFAMALRTIPALFEYVELIREFAPNAWLFTFANPSGMLTEAVTRAAGFERCVGICDDPPAMVRGAALALGVTPQDLFPEYFGLNHLGWLRALYLRGVDQIPALLGALRSSGARIPGLPFDIEFVHALGLIPSEYLFFYYYPRQSVENLLRAGQSRAQQILPFNEELYANLKRIRDENADPSAAETAYRDYLRKRHETYMTLETGEKPAEAFPAEAIEQIASSAEGYSGVAMDLIEGLSGAKGTVLLLNVPNRGAVPGMAEDDVVEVTCVVRNGVVRPIALGSVPDHALGLMKSVKAYERLTIEAAVERSYTQALKALALHPLVPSSEAAKAILDDYVREHGSYFPALR
jgi:6-phospho-beta-glucosidase